MQLSISLIPSSSKRKGKLVTSILSYMYYDWLIDILYCLQPAWKYFIYMDWRHLIIACEGMQNVGSCFAPMAVKSRDVSLLCNICFDMGPRFLRSHSKDGSLYDNLGILRTYSNPDPDQMFNLLTCTIVCKCCEKQKWLDLYGWIFDWHVMLLTTLVLLFCW